MPTWLPLCATTIVSVAVVGTTAQVAGLDSFGTGCSCVAVPEANKQFCLYNSDAGIDYAGAQALCARRGFRLGRLSSDSERAALQEPFSGMARAQNGLDRGSSSYPVWIQGRLSDGRWDNPYLQRKRDDGFCHDWFDGCCAERGESDMCAFIQVDGPNSRVDTSQAAQQYVTGCSDDERPTNLNDHGCDSNWFHSYVCEMDYPLCSPGHCAVLPTSDTSTYSCSASLSCDGSAEASGCSGLHSNGTGSGQHSNSTETSTEGNHDWMYTLRNASIILQSMSVLMTIAARCVKDTFPILKFRMLFGWFVAGMFFWVILIGGFIEGDPAIFGPAFAIGTSVSCIVIHTPESRQS
eukprot:SAG31_NODE_4622_length_3090_cov_1.329990_1_plen_351_part_00